MSKSTIHNFAKSQIRVHLKRGRENSTSRLTLHQITGLNDRTNRLLIEELRDEGVMVVSNSQNNGYWYPSKISEVKHYINEMRKRARELDHKANIAEGWLVEHYGELERDDNV